MTYDDLYRDFDSPLAQRMRREAYGEDIGQHSWVSADRLRDDVPRLAMHAGTRWLDVGCGACGPLTFVARLTGCIATGIDTSMSALVAGRTRARRMEIAGSTHLVVANADQPLPFRDASFDVITAFDVILHLADRRRTLAELARLLVPGGRLLVTDAGVRTGRATAEELETRSLNAPSRFAADGDNEAALDAVGFRLLARDDRTSDVVAAAEGRLRARRLLASDLALVEDDATRARETRYLQTTSQLAARGALSRFAYFAERRPDRT